jgi:hypothetical protein
MLAIVVDSYGKHFHGLSTEGGRGGELTKYAKSTQLLTTEACVVACMCESLKMSAHGV